MLLKIKNLVTNMSNFKNAFMNRKTHIQHVVAVVFVFIAISNLTVVRAQTSENTARFLLEVTDKLRFYELDVNGVGQQIYELSNDFALLTYGEAEWIIPIPESIVVSPQADKIAFVAIQNYMDSALFWFEIAQPTLHQIPIPGLGGLIWSPDGSKMLLFPDGVEISMPVYVNDAYVYSFETGSLNPIVNPVNKAFGNFHWLDSHRILYRAQGEDCTTPCIDAANLFLLDLDTHTTTRLTDIGHQLTTDAPNNMLQYYFGCRADIVVWSSANNRLYYSVNCVDTSDQLHSYLYSGDLSGDNQLEVDLLSLQPENFYSVIQSIHVLDGKVYFTVESEIRPKSEGAEAIYGNWRVYALSGIDDAQVISEIRFDGAAASRLGVVEASPNNQRLMLGGLDYTSDQEGYFAVVDLESEHITLQGHVGANICDIEWLDDTHAIFLQFPSICGSSLLAPVGINLLNLATGRYEEMSSSFSGPFWIYVPQRSVIPSASD